MIYVNSQEFIENIKIDTIKNGGEVVYDENDLAVLFYKVSDQLLGENCVLICQKDSWIENRICWAGGDSSGNVRAEL